MKKKTYVIACTAMFLASASFAFAQNTQNDMHGMPPSPRPGFLQTVLSVFRNERASTTATYRTDIKDDRQDMHTNDMSITQSIRAVMMFRLTWIRVNATAIRLEKILANLDSRIAKINAAGGDTATATGLAGTASTTLSVAQTDITNIKAILDSVSSTTPLDGTATSTIAADFKDAQTNLQTSQKDMEQAVQSLLEIKLSTASSTNQ